MKFEISFLKSNIKSKKTKNKDYFNKSESNEMTQTGRSFCFQLADEVGAKDVAEQILELEIDADGAVRPAGRLVQFLQRSLPIDYLVDGDVDGSWQRNT